MRHFHRTGNDFRSVGGGGKATLPQRFCQVIAAFNLECFRQSITDTHDNPALLLAFNRPAIQYPAHVSDRDYLQNPGGTGGFINLNPGHLDTIGIGPVGATTFKIGLAIFALLAGCRKTDGLRWKGSKFGLECLPQFRQRQTLLAAFINDGVTVQGK